MLVTLSTREFLVAICVAVALLSFVAAKLVQRHWYQCKTDKHPSSGVRSIDSTALLPKTVQRRRSSRIGLSIPLIVSAVSAGNEFSFRVAGATVLVNMHGALIQTPIAGLRLGMQVVVIVVRSGEAGAARVVWLNPQFEGQYGIELEMPRNIWGVYFPPADWQAAAMHGHGPLI